MRLIIFTLFVPFLLVNCRHSGAGPTSGVSTQGNTQEYKMLKSTQNVQSSGAVSDVKATSCEVEVMEQSFANTGERIVKIFIASDAAAQINFAVEIDRAKLPLSEGEIARTSGSSTTYENGILRYNFEEQDRGVGETLTVALEIDPNLTEVKYARAEETFAGQNQKGEQGQLTQKFIECTF